MLDGKRIRLRLIGREDLESIIEWRNSQDAYESFFTYTPLNLDLQEKWYEKQVYDDSQQNFAIIHKETGIAIGMIALVGINHKMGHAEWGRVIVAHPNFQGGGYGREAIELIMEYAFDHLNLRRLTCTALTNNKKVVGLYERLGFRQEGTLREFVYKKGEYIDVILFGMLRREYRDRQRLSDQ